MKNKIFEWDDEKARANLRKHRVSFEEAATAFSEWGAPVSGDALHSTSEDRFIIIATSERERLLAVAFTCRDDETIRVISARRANRREQRIYDQEKRSN
ncbi:MAG TPA: BrnT family toxin [Thermoanaerobaculia bacterium]|nr:BrnT family toxin [Thermoanaerobaculia bacterium]